MSFSSSISVSPLRRRLLVLALAAPGTLAAAQSASGPLTLSEAQGSVEIQGKDSVWVRVSGPLGITSPLRVGTGRGILRAGARGEIVMGSASQFRFYRDEADLTSGRFFLRGPVAVHVQGVHLVMEGAGEARVDLSDSTRRVAVISGALRLALPGGVEQLKAGQQLALKGSRISAFKEEDPWYASQFRGPGDAVIEATRGPVRLRSARLGIAGSATTPALIGDPLEPGARLTTDAGAWAEVGFSGGGYLRLNESGELSVLSVERTSTGREVLLRLEKGTAWNVVEKGQGGYRIDTPLVSTAVRGTVFRVDASGVVKVFEGQVVTPSDGDQPIAQGQQRTSAGGIGGLQLDATDKLNQALDAERAVPLILSLSRSGVGGRPLSLPELALEARSLPGAAVSVTVAGQTVPVSGTDGLYRLERLNPSLPEGVYRVRINARRSGQSVSQTQLIRIDRTPPALEDLQLTREGRVLSLSGRLRDASGGPLTVTVKVGTQVTTRFGGGEQTFQYLLPNLTPDLPVSVSVRDEAGNETNALLP
ncbi:FecR family protein [Deinococcus koreensis]|uniref:FecR protein domain-containing protein n=1 Tax=Deinococcus koreensis TaxID=2054903 RepID=A0A2K3UWW4_9DEIO|nr:FecR family protein [Deinococcus koreensis]PNY81032.1 hypothetical protein CVO96_06250 [Deinococcus koreensis]